MYGVSSVTSGLASAMISPAVRPTPIAADATLVSGTNPSNQCPIPNNLLHNSADFECAILDSAKGCYGTDFQTLAIDYLRLFGSIPFDP